MIKLFKGENRIENNVQKGLPTKLMKRDKIFIIRKFVKKPRLNTVKVTTEFNKNLSVSVSPEIVR